MLCRLCGLRGWELGEVSVVWRGGGGGIGAAWGRGNLLKRRYMERMETFMAQMRVKYVSWMARVT